MKACPNDTHEIINKKCLDTIPENFYFDSNDNIYKNCYDTCKTCSGSGNETNHNCNECKSNYTFIYDSLNDKNCFKICKYYYYFDEENKYHCTENEQCPENYNKLIEEKKQCLYENKSINISINGTKEFYSEINQNITNNADSIKISNKDDDYNHIKSQYFTNIVNNFIIDGNKTQDEILKEI